MIENKHSGLDPMEEQNHTGESEADLSHGMAVKLVDGDPDMPVIRFGKPGSPLLKDPDYHIASDNTLSDGQTGEVIRQGDNGDSFVMHIDGDHLAEGKGLKLK